MQCNEFESRIHELLDARRRPEEDRRIARHAEQCRECAQNLMAQELLITAVELFEPPRISNQFTDRVMANLDSCRPPVLRRRSSEPGRRRDVLVAIAMVAALLLVALVPIVQRAQPKIVGTKASEEDASIVPLSDAPGVDAVNQTPGTISTSSDRSPVPLSESDWSPLALLYEVEIPEVAFHSDDIPGVRPFTNSVNVAISLIRQTLAGGKSLPSESPPAASLPPDRRGMASLQV